MSDYRPLNYVDNGRTHPDKTDLTPEVMEALRNGEIFTIVEGKTPVHRLLVDSFGEFRTGSLSPTPAQEELAHAFFGVPPYKESHVQD